MVVAMVAEEEFIGQYNILSHVNGFISSSRATDRGKVTLGLDGRRRLKASHLGGGGG